MTEDETRALLSAVPHIVLAVGGNAIALSPAAFQRVATETRTALDAFHRAHPELPGLSAERLAAIVQPRLPPKIFTAAAQALVQQGTLALQGGALRSPGHRFFLDPHDARLWARIAPMLSDAERFRPPLTQEIAAALKEPEAEVRRVLKALARQRTVVEVALDRFFRRETVEEIQGLVVEIARAQKDGHFSAAQLRDRLDNGRKVAIQILEYFDGQGLTVRRGDLRRINPRRLDLVARAS
jgi:selenocysteine-specific elongation factor